MAKGDKKRLVIPEIDLDIEAEEDENGEYSVTDDEGSVWTETSYRKYDGSVGDTFGPGRKNVPLIVRHLRGLKDKG